MIDISFAFPGQFSATLTTQWIELVPVIVLGKCDSIGLCNGLPPDVISWTYKNKTGEILIKMQ